MAEVALRFLLENLEQLLLHHPDLFKNVKDEVYSLEMDLRRIRAFLKDTSEMRRKDDAFRELIHQIRDVVYEAEDMIDRFVTEETVVKTQNYFKRALRTPVNLYAIAKKVESISVEITKIYGGAPVEKPEDPQVRRDDVVGFEDEAAKIIGYLNENTSLLDVISIVGMAGLGKTTLAMKVFGDENIRYQFPIRIWVYVSREFTRKDLYLTILKRLTNITEDMCQGSDLELAQITCKHLEKGKFLIVMDDVWTIKDWEEIQLAFPKRNGACKVLITSRHKEVAQHANLKRNPHVLRFLTQEESWLLFKHEVFEKHDCPHELEALGKLIAEQCNRLPLAIVVMGGLLLKKISTSNNIHAKKNAMEKVFERIGAYASKEPLERLEEIITLNFDKLPRHLTACFLYLGMFPEDFEIPVWKLIRMWIAEGFIPEKEGISLEETAENYLDELISRNLVRADKRRPDGKVKTCRIHDMMHDMCIHEAGSEKINFFQVMKRSSQGWEPPIAEIYKYRRICIHSNVLKDFLSLKPSGPHVRSFVCFSKEDTALPLESTSAIPTAFKLLRVLDVKPIKFTKIPNDMFQLVHLGYIALSFTSAILPGAFARLWNIETLIVDTSSPTLKINANIWKMRRLRHLKTNVPTSLPMVQESDQEGEKLQTLGTISPQSCTEKVFDRARNLKTLGIRGQLTFRRDDKTVLFNNLVKLRYLEKLKLLNKVPGSESKLHGLPQPYQFPPKLKRLTLSNTSLDWDHMSILGLLENLQVLKLKDKAFLGKSWVAKGGGFRSLEVLHIGRTDLSIWVASDHHYPRLRCLELYNCEDLTEVPIGLAEIPTFQMLDLYRSNKAATSAIRILEAKQKNKGKRQNIKAGGDFKLSIFPPPGQA